MTAPYATTGPNLVSNGSFDTGINGWDLGPSPAGHGILTWDPDAQAARITYQQTSLEVSLYQLNAMPVTAGVAYRATATVSCPGTPRPTLAVVYTDTAGARVGLDTTPPDDDGLLILDTTPPALALFARVVLTPAADRAAGTSDVYLVDDVTYATYTPDPTEPVVPVTVPTTADLAAYLGILESEEPLLGESLAYAVAQQATLCDVTTYTEALHYGALRRAARWLTARGAPLGVAAGEYGASPLYRWDAEIEAAEAPYRIGTLIG